jgi:D-glycero-alpha-D-manno-heptose-7-phosphate kinase
MANGVSSGQIDDWYEAARANGAIGGKITGAGGGGFLLLYAPVERHQAIEKALPDLRRVSFGFEPHGTSIIYIEESEHV